MKDSFIKLCVAALFLSFCTAVLLQAPFFSASDAKAQAVDDDEDFGDCTPEECPEEDDVDTEPEPDLPLPPPPPPISFKCTEDTWKCEDWSTCSSKGVQTRTCKLVDDCTDVKTAQPATSQSCKYTPPEPPPPSPAPKCTEDTWKCEAWGTCSVKGVQTRTCKLVNDCAEAKTAHPGTSQSCKYTPPPPAPAPEPSPPSAPKCTEDTWECGDFGVCSEKGEQTRTCKLLNDCAEVKTVQPASVQACTPPSAQETQEKSPPEEDEILPQIPQVTQCSEDIWVCGDFGTCSPQGNQTRSCKLSYDCEFVETEAPSQSQTCSVKPNIDMNVDTDRDGIPDVSDQLPSDPDANNNGIVDGVDEQTGQDQRQTDQRDQEIQRVLLQELSVTGARPEEMKTVIYKAMQKKRAERKITKIREVARSKYKKRITQKDDANEDGISDEVAVTLGVDPRALGNLAELKIYSSNPQIFGKKCTTSIFSGNKLPAKGFTILSSCPKNKLFTLYANGKAIATKEASGNNKLVFTIGRVLVPGRYILQVKSAPRLAAYLPDASLRIAVENSNIGEESDPVDIEVIAESELEQPIIERIEGLDVSGISDISLSSGKDGKIHVTGTSDINTTVIGTFSSAVFTSALLADVDTGAFEVVSSQALENGEHEVVIYATRPEDGIQSPPARLSFRIVETAQAAGSVIEVTDVRPSAPTKKQFPLVPVLALSGLAILLIGIGIFFKKNKSELT